MRLRSRFTKSLRGSWLWWLRLAIGVGLLAGVAVAGSRAQSLEPPSSIPAAVLAVGVMAIGIAIAGLRWWFALRAVGLGLDPRRAMSLSFKGLFFANFVPSGLAGDVWKATRVRLLSGWRPAIASIVLERTASVCVLAVAGAVAAVVLAIVGSHRHLTAGAVLSAGAGFVGVGIAWVGIRRLQISVVRVEVWASVGMGVLYQTVLTLLHLCVFRAFAVTGVSLLETVAIASATTVASFIPLSLNGLGFRDLAYLLMLSATGTDGGTAVAVALAIDALMFLSGLTAGLALAAGKVRDALAGTRRPGAVDVT